VGNRGGSMKAIIARVLLQDGRKVTGGHITPHCCPTIK
jgi:hypothetical protein